MALSLPLFQVFKEEEEAVKVELHEGCGRIKLYWTMALADYRTLKGMIEFRETGSGECDWSNHDNHDSRISPAPRLSAHFTPESL